MKNKTRGNFKRTKKRVSLTLLEKNLSQTKKNATNVVLVTSGCYSPPHNFHVLLLKSAKSFLEAEHNYDVCAGFICPASFNWLIKKYRGDKSKAFGNEDRKTLLTRLINHFECESWLSIDSTDMDENDFIFSYSESILTLLCQLKHFVDCQANLEEKKIHKYIYVCGGDLLIGGNGLKGVRSYNKGEFGVCCVARPGYDTQKFLKDRKNLYITKEVGIEGCSSTTIRKKIAEGKLCLEETWIEESTQEYLFQKEEDPESSFEVKKQWKFESYLVQSRNIWPGRGKFILAQFDEDSVVVYQAFNKDIADYAVKNQKFEGCDDYNHTRMTWIKPNFIWMMFRSKWASKPNQKHIVAIFLKRKAFDTYLEVARVRGSSKIRDFKGTVRLQWDPDHYPNGQKHPYRRAIQLGLRNIETFANGTDILRIEDISDFVRKQGETVRKMGKKKISEELLVARERVYVPKSSLAIRSLDLDKIFFVDGDNFTVDK